VLTISKPLSAGRARQYHAEEFRNGRDNYYSTGDEIGGQWHGRLAAQWGLEGEVREEHFHRLSDGQHPTTGESLVRHQTAREYTNARGDSVKTMEHRAGWDATFSAPKSVSLTALVGGDSRVRDAHRASVSVALDELEGYVQARIGRNHPAETTGKWAAATFEHDSARPVNGYSAPQLHTHTVFFNVTETGQSETHAIQPRELYKTQQYATAVYRSELASRLVALGYDIERGPSGQPEIRGYTPEYLEASSPRRQQIQAHLEKDDHRGAEAAQIAAHQTREPKLDLSHEEVLRRHQAMAVAFGDQPAHVVQAAIGRAQDKALDQEMPATTAQVAMTFARDRNLEREAVVDERDLLRDALKRSMGETPFAEIKAEFGRRVGSGEFIALEQRAGSAGRAFTSREMVDLERETIEFMRAGHGVQPELASAKTRQDIEQEHPHLTDGQRSAIQDVLASRDQILALDGVAGAGKTTTLSAVREAVEREGHVVEGFAPTSRAAQQLAESGIPSTTLQRHLAKGAEPDDGRIRLYVLDESSLASTRQVHALLERLHPQDRVLLVGDARQHQAVDAGQPYQQLQEAGMHTARLEDIIRQRDPALKSVVEQLSRGDVHGAVEELNAHGRVHQIIDRDERFKTIAREYARDPNGTLVVAPDNRSRQEINDTIHRVMQDAGQVNQHEYRVRVLVARQEITGADRQWAQQYEPGNVLRYTRGSQILGIEGGEYARVEEVNQKENLLTVTRANGNRVSYDPRRLQGVTLYRETERAFAAGDRLQFTAPDRELHVANRELGTIEQIDAGGWLRLRLDAGQTLTLRPDSHPHLDYGYAVTSHSSQGQTTDRVIVHVDTERASEQLVNRRFAYVAISRARHDAHIYANDQEQLPQVLSRDLSHRSAIELRPARLEAAQTPSAPASTNLPRHPSVGHAVGR